MTDRIDDILDHCAAHPRRWIAALALVTVVLGSGLLRLEVITDSRDFINADSVEQADFDAFRDRFGLDEAGFVILASDDPFAPVQLNAYRDLHRELEQLPLVADDGGRVRSLLTSQGADGAPLLTDDTDITDPALRERVLNAPFVDRFVSVREGQSYLALVTSVPGRDAAGEWTGGAALANYARALSATVARADAVDGVSAFVVSEAVLVTESTDRVGQMIGIGTALQFLLIVVITGFCFGLRAALFPLIVIGLSLVWMLGLMGWLGIPLNAFSQVLMTLVMVSGVADSVHLLHRYASTWRSGDEPRAAVAEAIAGKRAAIVFTSLTTAAGFASFGLVGLSGFAVIGIFGAVGVTFAMIVSMILAAATLSWFVGREPRPVVGRIGNALDRIASWSWHHKGLVLGGTGVLLLVSLIGVPRLDFALSARTILGNESDLFATIDTLDELGAGGGLQIELLYTNENPGGVISDAGSARLAEISEILDRTRIGGEPLFVEAHVGDLLDLAAATQPNLGAEELAELLRSADTFGNLDALVTSDDEAARITLSASFISNTDLAREAEPLQAEFDALAGPGERIRLTGTGLAAGISAESTFPDIVRSYALALGIVAALVALAVRSLGRGLVSMVPNLLPAVLLAGAMGLAGIPISMMTIVVGAVLIGVSVDDTVHVVHATFIADGGSNQPKAVVAQTMRETGPALSLTSAIVTLGLITFALMPLVGLRQIAWLGALAIALALAADVIVLPALIALISRDRDGVSPE